MVEAANITALQDQIDQLVASIDLFYFLFAGVLVFFMQAGFAMLCAGSVRQKNVKNIMLKNILDACGGALGFWSIGFALSQGEGKSNFVGDQESFFFLQGVKESSQYIVFFFHFTFAATAATIVAGTIAERCKMVAYLLYSVLLTAFVYPVVNHSVWNSNGFMNAFREDALWGSGMVDFAGSGVVHMTGGCTALVAAIILGPRRGRFYDNDGNVLPEPVSFPPHSVALQVLGTFILWFGWYGFNPGSTLGISGTDYDDVSALCAVTTTIAAATGCVSALFTDSIYGFIKTGEAEYDITYAMNGCLSGLVGITAGCSVVTPWAAFVIGLIAGWIYCLSSALLVKLRIDDAVDAIPVHFFNGMWGCIATGLFAEKSRMALAGYAGAEKYPGWFYSNGEARLLACEIIGILWIIGWVLIIMTPFFFILKITGLFRVDPLEEDVGLDISHHRGAAYDFTAAPKKSVEDLNVMRATKHGSVEEPVEAVVPNA